MPTKVALDPEPGAVLKQPFGILRIEDKRGESYENREWQIHDPDTGETLWVDHDFLLSVTLANITR